MPSYFVRFTQQVPGTDEERRQQMIRFIGAMWDQIEPVVTGKVKGEPEAPPEPVKEDH